MQGASQISEAKRLIVLHGLKAAHVARRAELNPSTVTRVLNEESDPRVSTAERILGAARELALEQSVRADAQLHETAAERAANQNNGENK